jgi:hypothetical protein
MSAGMAPSPDRYWLGDSPGEVEHTLRAEARTLPGGVV